MTVMTNKERISMAKSATAKTRLKVTHSVPVLPSGPVPQLSTSTASSTARSSSCNRRGASSPSSGVADRISLQSGNPSPVCDNTHSLSSTELDQHPMNSVVIDTPEPYLEPIKTLSSLPLGGGEVVRSRSTRRHKTAVAVGLAPPLESPDSRLDKKQVSLLSPPSSASTFYRPIPPPKVVLQIQKEREEHDRSSSSQRDEALALRQKKKHSELAYLIVDLDSVGCPIESDTSSTNSSASQGPSCNKKVFDDSYLSVKTKSTEDNSRFPIRSNTMSSLGAKRPPKPRPPPKLRSLALAKDSLKDIPALPNELDKESRPSDSASPTQERKTKEKVSSESEEGLQEQRPKPPPRRRPPPRPRVTKMASLPSSLSPTNRKSLGEERKTSLPSVSSKSIAEDNSRRTSAETTGSLNSTVLNEAQRGTTTPRTPPSRPKPYASRNSATPPPPSFHPPSPLAGMTHRRSSSFTKSEAESPDNATRRGVTHTTSESKLKPSNSSPKIKPSPPARPPPPNPKTVQKSPEIKLKSKSTSDIKQQSQNRSVRRRSPAPTTATTPPAPRIQISEPQLISSTVSRTLSVTDIQGLKQNMQQEAEKSSVESTAQPADYEDIDFDDNEDLPPVVPNKLSKSQTPSFGRKSSIETPPSLPPRGSKTDPLARRIAVSPLFSSLSKNVTGTLPSNREDPPCNPPVKVKQAASVSTKLQDHSEPDYEKIDVSDDENEVESSSACEADIGGIDDYVTMDPVLVSAWEDGNLVSSVVRKSEGEKKDEANEDEIEESYVEMHPADHFTNSNDSNKGEDVEEDDLYWNDSDTAEDPIYIEMNPNVYIPAPDPGELHYASKDLLTKRPDLQATKKSVKPNLKTLYTK